MPVEVKLEKKDPERMLDRIARAKRHPDFKKWWESGKENVALYANDKAAWDRLGGYSRRWKHRGTYMNLLRLIGESEIYRTMAKDPQWRGKPLAPMTREITGPDGQVTLQPHDNRKATQTVVRLLNVGTARAKLLQQTRACYEDAWKWNVGWLQFGMPSGSDLSTTSCFVLDKDNPNRTVPTGGIMHGQANLRVPWALRIPPQAIVEDSDARSWEEVNWVSKKIVRPFADIQNDPRYKEGIAEAARAGNRIKANTIEEDWQARSMKENSKPDDLAYYGTIQEVHNRFYDPEADGGFVHYITSLYPNGGMGPIVLRHVPYPVPIGGFCFSRLTLAPINDDLKGQAPMDLLKDQNGLLIYLMGLQTEWAVRTLPKYMVSKSGMTPDELTNLASGEIGMIVPTGAAARDAVSAFPNIPIPPELQNLAAITRANLDETSAQSPAQRLTPTGVSAGETREIASNAMEFIRTKKGRVKEWLNDGAKKFLRMQIAMLEPGGRWTLPGLDGAFFEFELADLLGAQFEMDVEWKSMAEEDPVVERKLNQELAMTLKQMEGPEFKLKVKPIMEHLCVGANWEPEEIMENPETPPWDPAVEHMKILDPESPKDPEKWKPNQGEDFTQTVPVHREFAALVTREAGLKKLWLQGPEGPAPYLRLMAHIKMSEDMAIVKGQGKALGLQNPGGGARGPTGFQRGSGPAAGRPTPGLPNAGDMMSHAGAVDMQGMGMGRGIQ